MGLTMRDAEESNVMLSPDFRRILSAALEAHERGEPLRVSTNDWALLIKEGALTRDMRHLQMTGTVVLRQGRG